MWDFNQVTMVCRVAKEAEIKNVGGYEKLSFLVANNPTGKEEKVSFFNVGRFFKDAGKAGKFAEVLRKGLRILICGQVQIHTYEKEGKKSYFTEITADKIEILDARGQKQRSDDALPF